MFRSIIICLIAFGSISSFAQKGFELGGWLGASNYFGDLNTNFRITDPGPAAGIIGRYNFDNRISARMGLNYGYVYASDNNSNNAFELSRNLNFKSHIIDLTGGFEFNFFPYTHGSRFEYYTPYLLAGFSVFRFSPHTELDGQTYYLRDMGTEGQRLGNEYFLINGALTYGLGFKWDINSLWSFNVEFSGRKLFTDYLDDVSTTYASNAQIAAQRGAIAAALADRSIDSDIGDQGRQRGNSRNNDNYTFIGIGIVRYFGRLECPKITR